ncbi:beta-hexosaminidase [Vibrio maritimus]|uniref:Beta-hexosaminidase n=1 Tax=Vibrio maritimus TaxID=990268 RepID=A0A090RNZ5_9VIBR|nr:beta-hexosaminidase [Vibrio maritimus]
MNRFADALPVESYAVYEMRDLVEQFDKGDKQVLSALERHYQTVLNAATAAEPIFAANVASVDTVAVTKATKKIAELGLTLVAKAQTGEVISKADSNAYQGMINESAIIIDETIVAIVKPTEMLLEALSE